MKIRAILQLGKRHPLLVLLLALIGLSFSSSGMASANYASIPQVKYPYGQFSPYQEDVNLNAGTNSPSGGGANVPDTYFKLYTNSNPGSSRAISVYVVPVTSNPGNCTNYSIGSEFLSLDSQGNTQLGAFGTQVQNIPSCGVTFNITVPASAWTASGLTGQNGIYFAELHLFIIDPGNTHSSYLRVDTTASFPNTRIGNQGGIINYTTVFPRTDPNQPLGGDYSISAPFAKTCNSSNSFEGLQWGDDDWGDPTQQNKAMTIDVIEKDRYTGATVTTYHLAYQGGGITGFSGQGSKTYGPPPGGWSSKYSYTLLFNHVDGGNGIWFSAPFDEGNWYTDCPLPTLPPAGCNGIGAISAGSSTQQTLIRVEDQNGKVLIPGGPTSPGTGGPTTTGYTGDGNPAYNPVNPQFPTGRWTGQSFFIVPSGGGGPWSYTAAAPSVEVTIITRDHAGGVWTTTNYSDVGYDCYHASCSISIDSNVPGSPANGVKANAPFTAEVTINAISWGNSGDLPGTLNGAPLQINNGDLSGTGGNIAMPNTDAPPGGVAVGTSVTFPVTLNAPSGQGSKTIIAHPAYPGVTDFGTTPSIPPILSVCSATVDLYQDFTLTPYALSTPLPSLQAPTNDTNNTWVVEGGSAPSVSEGVNSSLYEINTAGTQIPQGSPSSKSSSGAFNNGASSYLYQNYNYTIPTPPPLQAGDEFCAETDVQYTSGWVDQSGNISGGSTTNNKAYDCPIVINEPFFKMYNSSISTGNSFVPPGGGSCSGGELASWNDNTGVNPVSGDFGAGTILSTLAATGITGFASNQKLPSTLNGTPTDLAFANNPPGSSPSLDSPALGGNFGTSGPCLSQPSQAPGTSTTGGSTANINSIATGGGQQSYSYGTAATPVNLTLNSGNIPVGDNVTVYVNGNVYIAGSGIRYKGDSGGPGGRTVGWNTTKNVPSFALYATGNIYIDPGVTELDGIYNAEPDTATTGGKIYTCGLSTFAPMDQHNLYSQCNNQLTIYGNFEANQVNMMRTYGSLRDETPVPATFTTGPGPQVGFVWSSSGTVNGMVCSAFDEGSAPSSSTWGDNYLCVPAGSPVSLCYEQGAPYPCTGCHFMQLDPSSSPYYGSMPGYWQDNAFCPSGGTANSMSFSWGSPPPGSTVLTTHHDVINNQNYPDTYTTSTSYCTLLYEDSDPTTSGSNLVWEHTYLCEPLAPTVPVVATYQQSTSPTCSNPGVTSTAEPTCAAEVFDFSPEFYMSNWSQPPPSNGTLQYQTITGLPPVL